MVNESHLNKINDAEQPLSQTEFDVTCECRHRESQLAVFKAVCVEIYILRHGISRIHITRHDSGNIL
jgi:hypothetical protein